jgi:sortase A
VHERRILRFFARACLGAGAILLAICAYSWADAFVCQARQSRRFDPSAPVVAESERYERSTAQPSIGSAIGRLEVPRIGLSVVVLEGDDADTLRRGLGRIPGIAWIGQAGNVGIAGHRDTFFRSLRNIHNDDLIRLVSLDRVCEYRVELSEVVGANDIEVLDSGSQPVVTLVSCYPFFYVGTAPKPLVVRARQIWSELWQTQ